MKKLTKEYKQTEVGLIPSDWEVKTLENLSTRIGDGIHSTPIYSSNGEYYFVNGNNLINGSIIIAEDTKRVSKVEYLLNKRDINQTTVLLSINGTIGNIAFYNDEKIVLGKSAAYINLNDKIDKRLFYQLIQAQFIKKYFDDELTGSTIKNLGLGSIRNTPIPLPPTFSEQIAICTALSDTDALISSLEKLITKKSNIKQASMQKLLQSKKNWEVKKLGDIFNFYNTANYSKAEMTFDGEIGCLHYGLIHAIPHVSYSLKNGVKFYLKEDNTKYELIQDGDIVMVDASEDFLGINKCIEVSNVENRKFIAGLHTYLMRDVNNILMKNFRGLILNAAIVKQQLLKLAVGMKVYGVSKTQLKEVLIPVPPHEEQIRIATILSDMDAEIIALETKLEKYKKVKLGMMQNLLTGKIRLV